MKFLLSNVIILVIIYSISASQQILDDPYGADQSSKLPELIRMNQYLSGRYEQIKKNDDIDDEEDYDKLMSSSTVQTSTTSTSTKPETTPVSTSTDILEELYDKFKEKYSQYNDQQEVDEDGDEDENDYAKSDEKVKSTIRLKDSTDNEVDDDQDAGEYAEDDEYNSIDKKKLKDYENGVEKLLKSFKKSDKTTKPDDDEDEDEDDKDSTDEDFDYTTQANDYEKDEENDDDDENVEKQDKDSQQIKSLFNNILDLIQLDKMLSSESNIFKQSPQPAQSDSIEDQPIKKKKKLIVVLFSNKRKPKQPSALQSSSLDYEQKTLIRSAASKSAIECSNESIQANIMRTITKVSLLLASVSLCVLILLTLLRFFLIRNKKNASAINGYNKLENVDTILEKV